MTRIMPPDMTRYIIYIEYQDEIPFDGPTYGHCIGERYLRTNTLI